MKIMLSRQSLIRFFVFLILGASLKYITQNAPTPEKAKDLWFALPAFLVFILFFIGICSWGALIRSSVRLITASNYEVTLFDLAVGSLFAYLASYLLTPIGLFGASKGFFLWALLSFGFSNGSQHLNFKKWFNFGNTWYSKFFMSLVPLVILLKLVEGIQFHQHGDAYVTYLVGPRMWGESGSFNGFLRYSQFFLSTSWESLYAWGTALMGFRGGAGLDISQWFSQWVTGGIGVFGTLLAILAICNRMASNFKISSNWFPVIAVSSIQIEVLRWTQNLAKNDFGIIFWGLSAFYFSFFCAGITPVFAFFAGALTGAAVVGKLTVVFFGVLLSLYVFMKNTKNAIHFITGGLVGSLPVFVRNYFLTNNPVFPWMPKVFPSPYLSDFAEHGADAATQAPFKLSDLIYYLNELFHQVPFVFSILIVLFIAKYRKGSFKLVIIPLISFFLFTISLRPSTGIRYQNATLVLIYVFSVYFSFFFIELFSEKFVKFKKNYVSLVFGVFLIATANISFFTFFQIGNDKKFTSFSKRMIVTNEIGGPAKVWIRSNINPSEKIISFGDVHIYYLIDYALTEVGQSVEYGKKIFHSTLDEAEQVLKNAPFDYLYLAGEDYYKDATFAKDQAKIADIMVRANGWNLNCKKFDNSKAQVWDLKCLRNNTQ